jgi:multimeric flavodoxin WrbA
MDEMIKGIEENGGEVVKYYLEDKEIAPCKACMYCAEHPECVRADDGNEIIDALVDADGVIFSTPI